MERKENRFAFRGSNELGEFLRQMARQTGWDASEVIRFGLGYWMMHVKHGVFAAFSESQYGGMLKKINTTSRDLIPEGDIDSISAISNKYAKAIESERFGNATTLQPDDVESSQTPLLQSQLASRPPSPEQPPKPKSNKRKSRAKKSKKTKKGKSK